MRTSLARGLVGWGREIYSGRVKFIAYYSMLSGPDYCGPLTINMHACTLHPAVLWFRPVAAVGSTVVCGQVDRADKQTDRKQL